MQAAPPRSPSSSETALWVVAAMLAFAGNSLLCRLALKSASIDPGSFAAVRLVSGAAVLWLLQHWRVRAQVGNGAAGAKASTLGGDWLSAAALFAYAALFSWAYVGLSTATGALLLFGAVQASMISWGLSQGERLAPQQWLGLLLALAGLVVLMYPGLAAPAWGDSLAMLAAGVAWGVYSLRGKRPEPEGQKPDPTRATAGNFIRTVPMAVVLALVAALLSAVHVDISGLGLAVASGGITSGLGYAIWYRVLPRLKAAQAASVQLSVPVLAALGGVVLVGEAITWVLAVATTAILGGIALVLAQRR